MGKKTSIFNNLEEFFLNWKNISKNLGQPCYEIRFKLKSRSKGSKSVIAN